MEVALLVWTLVGYAGMQFSTHEKYDWRPVMEFRSPYVNGAANACKKAAVTMGARKFLCIDKRTGELIP